LNWCLLMRHVALDRVITQKPNSTVSCASDNRGIMSKEDVMQKSLFEQNGISCLGSVAEEPPPSEPCCEGCGRPFSQLKPFGDPVTPYGDLTTAKLVRNFRADHHSPPQEVIEAIKTADETCSRTNAMPHKDWFPRYLAQIAEQLGCTEEEVEEYLGWESMSRTVGSSWECRDCISLSTKRFHRMRINLFFGKYLYA
jgi:hypothetical protein